MNPALIFLRVAIHNFGNTAQHLQGLPETHTCLPGFLHDLPRCLWRCLTVLAFLIILWKSYCWRRPFCCTQRGEILPQDLGRVIIMCGWGWGGSGSRGTHVSGKVCVLKTCCLFGALVTYLCRPRALYQCRSGKHCSDVETKQLQGSVLGDSPPTKTSTKMKGHIYLSLRRTFYNIHQNIFHWAFKRGQLSSLHICPPSWNSTLPSRDGLPAERHRTVHSRTDSWHVGAS